MLEEKSGRCVGVTNVCFKPDDPRMIWQWDTGVLESAQSQGIGKAVKLLMLRKVMDELDQARVIQTENAYSNDAMIAINDALGFKEYFEVRLYEMELGRLREIVEEMVCCRRPPGEGAVGA
jgi:hypothetical protein